MSFFDPLWTSNGEPLGPKRFKSLVEERYFISKNLHTSYIDVGEVTPTERKILIQIIQEQQEKEIEALRNARASR